MGIIIGKVPLVQGALLKVIKKPRPRITALAPRGSMNKGSSQRINFPDDANAYAAMRPIAVAINMVRTENTSELRTAASGLA